MFWSDACRVFEGIGAHDQAQHMSGGDHSAAHTALVLACRNELRRLGCMATKNLSGWATLDSGQRTLVGLGVGSADIVGILPGGRALACECKTGRGELSAEQARFFRAVNAVGGLGFVARSVEDVRRAVAGASRGDLQSVAGALVREAVRCQALVRVGPIIGHDRGTPATGGVDSCLASDGGGT